MDTQPNRYRPSGGPLAQTHICSRFTECSSKPPSTFVNTPDYFRSIPVSAKFYVLDAYRERGLRKKRVAWRNIDITIHRTEGPLARNTRIFLTVNGPLCFYRMDNSYWLRITSSASAFIIHRVMNKISTRKTVLLKLSFWYSMVSISRHTHIASVLSVD